MAISATRIPAASPGVGPSREEIAGVATRIAEHVHPEQIRLFGSRAYGVPHERSDVDLLVIWDSPLSRIEARQRIADAIEGSGAHRYQIHVYTPFEIRRGLREHDFFIEDMMLKGIALYQRSGARVSEDSGPPYAAPGPDELKHATRVWLFRAAKDARLAENQLSDPEGFPDHICFFAQQSVEKSLKGLLQQHETHFPRTHELDELARLAVPFVPELADYMRALEALSICAVEARYTDAFLSAAQAASAVETMRAVRGLILAVLTSMS